MTTIRSAMFIAISTVLLATAAVAQDRVQGLIQSLQTQGFSRIKVERTWLGRTRIEARGPNGEREIIVNDRTGEVLRDYFEDDQDDDDDDDDKSDRSGKSGSGGGDDDDGDDGDDGDRDGDSDGDSDGDDGGDGDD
ncbi:hypothetical protein [Pseudooceanicola sp. MF1-13]|uniref:hypothetical protein n=1 Tax=Pseudooceanicola sp. MF1-13 TaxID=3379095 RepID=UPI003892034E